jgi:hypothetical protein
LTWGPSPWLRYQVTLYKGYRRKSIMLVRYSRGTWGQYLWHLWWK